MQDINIEGRYFCILDIEKHHSFPWLRFTPAIASADTPNTITFHKDDTWFTKPKFFYGYLISTLNHETLHCVLNNMGLDQESCDLDNIYEKWLSKLKDNFYNLLM